MSGGESLAAAAFYVGLAAAVAGAAFVARSAVERTGGRRAGLALLAVGGAAIVVSLGLYARGSRTLLPF